mgnify:CR=1 FL=1
MRDIRDELEQEGSLWRERIEKEDVDEYALQRMRDGQLLAEFKLVQIEDS